MKKDNGSKTNLGIIITSIIAVIGIVITIIIGNNQDKSMEKQIQNQIQQIDHQKTQIALNEIGNQLANDRLTNEAWRNQILDEIYTRDPIRSTSYVETVTNLGTQLPDFESTESAIQIMLEEIHNTQTLIAENFSNFECSSEDLIPEAGGIHPQINRELCIPHGYICWISSDPAKINIPGIYEKNISTGFTFVFYGPVKFSISNVQSNYVRLDLRTDTSLLHNFDGKSVNLVYYEGKICENKDFTGESCP